MAVYEIDWQSNQQSDVAKMKCIIMKGAILDWLSSVYMPSSISPWLSMDLYRMNKKYTKWIFRTFLFVFLLICFQSQVMRV